MSEILLSLRSSRASIISLADVEEVVASGIASYAYAKEMRGVNECGGGGDEAGRGALNGFGDARRGPDEGLCGSGRFSNLAGV